MKKNISDVLPAGLSEVTRTTMYLDERTRETAREIGDGNMSAGWRILAAAARATPESMTKVKHAGVDQVFAEHKAER